MEQIEPSLGRKLAFVSIAIGAFLVLTAALGEATLRWIAPKSDADKLGVKLEGSARVYGLKPNHRSRQTGVMVQTNSLGFRENEYPLQRRPGVRRIVVLGDSFTFGQGVEFQEIYSKRLEAQLNRSGDRYEVINFGIPGYNTTLELATWREVAARFNPDLVILGYVMNDTEQVSLGKSGPTQPAGDSFLNSAHLALREVSMLYKFLAPRLSALMLPFDPRYPVGGTRQILASFEHESAGWAESRDALLELVGEARRAGTPALVVVFPMMVDSYPLEPAHRKVTRFCREHGIEVLDLMSVVLEQKVVSDMVVMLDGHPNGRAHKIFSERIYQHLLHNYALLKNGVEAVARGREAPRPLDHRDERALRALGAGKPQGRGRRFGPPTKWLS